MGIVFALARTAWRAVIAGGRGAADDLGVISVACVDEARQRAFFRWRFGVGELHIVTARFGDGSKYPAPM